MTIARGRPKLSPAVTFKLFLELDCLLDLIKFHIYQSVVFVSLGMDISKDLLRFLEFSFRNEPSWRFWNSPGFKVSLYFGLSFMNPISPDKHKLAD